MDRVNPDATVDGVYRNPRPEVGQADQLRLMAKARLGVEILLVYARIRAAFRNGTLPDLVERLRAPSRNWLVRGPLGDVDHEGKKLGDVVVRVLDPLPFDSRCLMRSLVLLRLLERRGAHSELVIAVQKGGTLELEAHAWIELKGRPLLTPALDGYSHLVTL